MLGLLIQVRNQLSTHGPQNVFDHKHTKESYECPISVEIFDVGNIDFKVEFPWVQDPNSSP